MVIKVIVILLAIIFVTACNVFTDDKNIEKNYSNPSYENMNNNNSGQFRATKVKQISSEKDVAKDLVQLADQVKGVKGATAVVSGMYSVVGIRFEDNLTSVQKERVKDNVYQALGTHPRGANTLIATKKGDLQKLRSMREKLNNTKIASGVYEDLGRLIGTLEPNGTNPAHNAFPSEEDLKKSKTDQEFSK